MAKDPACQMGVDEKKAIKSEYKRKTYSFYCLACQEAFTKSWLNKLWW